jgi:hypothetical protein
MSSLALPVRHHAVSETSPCPLARYGGHLHLGASRLQLHVHAQADEDLDGYTVNVWFDNEPIGQVKRAATASLALLGAVQRVARLGLFQLRTPIVPGLYYQLESDHGFRGLTLPRNGVQTYVVMGAVTNHNRGNRWMAFCEGFRDCAETHPNSFEALLRCVRFMIEDNIWP